MVKCAKWEFWRRGKIKSPFTINQVWVLCRFHSRILLMMWREPWILNIFARVRILAFLKSQRSKNIQIVNSIVQVQIVFAIHIITTTKSSNVIKGETIPNLFNGCYLYDGTYGWSITWTWIRYNCYLIYLVSLQLLNFYIIADNMSIDIEDWFSLAKNFNGTIIIQYTRQHTHNVFCKTKFFQNGTFDFCHKAFAVQLCQRAGCSNNNLP